MKLDIWMANTNDSERQMTLNFLKSLSVENLTLSKKEFFEFEFSMYADKDSDIIDVLKVLLFYNDRSSQSIERIADLVHRMLLLEGKRKDE